MYYTSLYEVLFRPAEYIATEYFHNSQIIAVDHVKKKVTFKSKAGLTEVHGKKVLKPEP